MFRRLLMLGPAALLAAACDIDRPHPTDATLASTATVAFSAVKFWEAGATVSWNELATDLAVAAPAPGINATRLYAYLALAQFRAAEAAQAPGPHPPPAGDRTRQSRRASLLSDVPGSTAAASATRIWKRCFQRGAGRGLSGLAQPDPRADRHRELLECEPVAAVPNCLYGNRARADRFAPPQRRRSRADHVRDERGSLRRAHRMLRCQVLLLVHPAPAGEHGDRDRVPDAAAPVVPVRPLLFLGRV